MKEEQILFSMAENTLGLAGKTIAWLLYLFLFYCLTIAYLVGCGDILHGLLMSQWPRIRTTPFLPIIWPFNLCGHARDR